MANFSNLTYQEYLDTVSKLTPKLDNAYSLVSWYEDIKGLQADIDKLVDKIRQLQNIDMSDLDSLRNIPHPESYDWFNDVSDDIADQLYDSYEAVIRRTDFVDEALDTLDDVLYNLYEVYDELKYVEYTEGDNEI